MQISDSGQSAKIGWWATKAEESKGLARFELSKPLVDGEEFILEFRVVGATLTALLNGLEIGKIEDTTQAEGAFGVISGKAQQATFTALEYLDLSKPAPSAIYPQLRE